MILFTYDFFDAIDILLFSKLILEVFSIFCFINYTDFFYLVFFLLTFWSLTINKTFREKFLYFFVCLVLVSSWGFFYSFDGIIILFLIAELLIVLLFLLLYLTLNFELIQTYYSKPYFIIYFFFGLIFYFLPLQTNFFVTFFQYINVYHQVFEIISGDFFLFFFFFFIIFPYFTILIGILLGFFSVFFILFYFNLKLYQQQQKNKNKNYLFLRKQQLLHQANYQSIIVNFQ